MGIMSVCGIGRSQNAQSHGSRKEQSYRGHQRAFRTPQAVAHDHAHVGCVQAGEQLRDLKSGQEILLRDPLQRLHKTSTIIGEKTGAEASSAHRQKDQEDSPQRWSGWVGWHSKAVPFRRR